MMKAFSFSDLSSTTSLSLDTAGRPSRLRDTSFPLAGNPFPASETRVSRKWENLKVIVPRAGYLLDTRICDLVNDGFFATVLDDGRQTGKSTLLKMLFPQARMYELLKTDVRMSFQLRPAPLREECELLKAGKLVIIDEVQKVPALLDEVHWFVENRGLRFILSGAEGRGRV